MSPLVVGIARTGVMLVAIVLSLPKGGAFFSKVCLRAKLDAHFTDNEKTLLKQVLGLNDWKNLEGETIQTHPVTGCILPSEILRLQEEYGIRLSDDYNFARTREFRLVNGRVVARQSAG